MLLGYLNNHWPIVVHILIHILFISEQVFL